MADLPKLSAADHALAHLLGWLVANIHADDPNRRVMTACLREVLPAVTRAHPTIRDLAQAGDALVRAAPGSIERTHARHAACAALMTWHMGRAGDALAVFRKGKPDAQITGKPDAA